MKVLVTVVVLAALSGAQAYVLREAPYPHLDQLNQELREYVRNFTRLVNEKLDLIRKSQLGQSVIDQIYDNYARVSGRLRKLEDELPTEVKQGYDRVVGASLSTLEKGLDAMRDVQRRVAPATDKLAEDLYSIVAPYANSVLEKIDTYTGALRRAVANRAQLDPKLKEKLKEQLEALRVQLATYTQVFQSRLQEFQRTLEPLAGKAQEKLQQGAEKVKQALQPYLSAALERLQTYTKDLKKWVDRPLFPPTP